MTSPHHHPQFALIQTSEGPVVLNVDNISHVTPSDDSLLGYPGPPDKRGSAGVRVHFRSKGGTSLFLRGITPLGMAEALNGAPF